MTGWVLADHVSAHHSRTGIYETNDKAITMEGVVAEWQWRNPHVFLVVDTVKADGTKVQWTGELSSTNSMTSEGMSRTSLKPGDKITFSVVPARSGAPQGLLVKVIMADGKVPLDRTRGPIPD
jgi:hypothetical protein